jgi:hypothetical protein
MVEVKPWYAGADPRESSQHLGVLGVLRLSLQGVPLLTDGAAWSSITVPTFPFCFTLAGGLLSTMVWLTAEVYRVHKMGTGQCSWDTFAIAVAGLLAWIGSLLLSNIILAAWCLLVLRLSRPAERTTRTEIRITQRVVYFAAIPQIGVAVTFSVLMTGLQVSYASVPSFVGYGLVAVLLASALVRLLVVFRGLLPDTQGSFLISGVGTIGCLDGWVAMLFIVQLLVNLAR